jgi:hypothetical protein
MLYRQRQHGRYNAHQLRAYRRYPNRPLKELPEPLWEAITVTMHRVTALAVDWNDPRKQPRPKKPRLRLVET